MHIALERDTRCAYAKTGAQACADTYLRVLQVRLETLIAGGRGVLVDSQAVRADGEEGGNKDKHNCRLHYNCRREKPRGKQARGG